MNIRKTGGTLQGTAATALLATGLLAACAVAARAMVRRAERDNPPRGQFVRAQGIRLHYTEHGRPDAPVLVILHGMGSMALEVELSGLVERAAQEFRVLVFDRPGYGHSDRPGGHSYTPQAQASLFVAALRALGVRNPIVLGHSWGSLVARAMAQDYPDFVRGVVLALGYHTPSLRFDTFFLSAPAIQVIGTLLRYTVSPILGRLLWPLMLWRMFAPAGINPAMKSNYPVWMHLRPGQIKASAAETAMLAIQAIRLRAREDTVRVPMVLVAGAKDRLLMTFWQSGRLHKRRGVPLHTIEGAGHMVHHTAPDRVMQAIREVQQPVA